MSLDKIHYFVLIICFLVALLAVIVREIKTAILLILVIIINLVFLSSRNIIRG